ncbi:MAG: hypothetical protein CMM07_15700 [Rhodopirellula sp.]|nr:hypothetical protein [Rhodopirellula sp.]
MHCGDEHQRSEHAPQPTPPTGDAAISTSNPGICSSLDRQHHEIRITSKSAPGVGNDSNPAKPQSVARSTQMVAFLLANKHVGNASRITSTLTYIH